MTTDYKQFEQTLQNYFKQEEISGKTHPNLEIKLEETQNGTWKNLWTKTATYKIKITEPTDQFQTITIYQERKLGNLIIKKSRNKLLVELMTTYKTRGDTKGFPLTLEKSHQIQLN